MFRSRPTRLAPPRTEGYTPFMLGVLRHRRARVAFAHDIIMASSSFPLSLYLRIGESMPELAERYLWQGTAIFATIAAAVFLSSRLYRGIWRYASINDLVALTKAVTLIMLIFVPLLFLITRLEQVPRSLPFINWFVLLAMLGGPRFLYRIVKDRRLDNILAQDNSTRVRILLVGAGDGADLFLRELRQDSDTAYTVLGILDEKGTRVGHEIHGVRVLGTIDELEAILKSLPFRPSRLVITKENLDGELVRRVVDAAEKHGLAVSRTPRKTELHGGLEADRLSIRPIAVEDLLGRPQQPLDRNAMQALVQGRRVLVTGAGGTIGSELVRQIAAFKPAHITLFDLSEYHLYAIDQEISERMPDLSREAVLGDVRDRAHILATMRRVQPDLVCHAAALKHVPMVEENPIEGIMTNAVGSRIVADACREAGVSCMVQISTDKAVNPANIMGATKRIAEAYIQALDTASRRASETRYVVVRFGNVLDSTGSVVPLFRRQLESGGPLTVTDPEATRFFMTVREAVELVLQAAAVGIEDADATGRIFVLDMGEPIKVIDLARQMIRLAGLRPDKDIQIKFIGLRPGEKLHEELLHGGEPEMPTRAPGMTLAAPRAGDLTELGATLGALEKRARARAVGEALRDVQAMVPEFSPSPEALAGPDPGRCDVAFP